MLLKSLLSKDVKVNFTIDDVRLKSNLTSNRRIKFTRKASFYVILGSTQHLSSELGDFEGFVQLTAGSYKSDKPVNITGHDEIHLKCDFINGSLVKGTREPILYSFALSSPPSHKIFKEPRIKNFKKINKPTRSHITLYLEDDDRKLVDFSGETISFTCQLIKIK